MDKKINAALQTLKGMKFDITQLTAAFVAQGLHPIHAGFACRAVWESGQVKWTGTGEKAVGRVCI